MSNDNPYYTYAGVFVPHRLLSARRLSHGAKLIYALLASRADLRGVSLLNPTLLAVETGESEEGVSALVGELESARMIKLQHDPAGTEFMHCHFPRKDRQAGRLPGAGGSDQTTQALKPLPRLLKITEPAKGDGGQNNHGPGARANQPESTRPDDACTDYKPGSRFTKQQCIEYAKARKEKGQDIKNPCALGTELWKSGEQDEEIMLWLQAEASDENVA